MRKTSASLATRRVRPFDRSLRRRTWHSDSKTAPAIPGEAIVARRGFTGWHLTVTAKTAHSSQIFRDDVGAGAIFEASRVLQAFYEELAHEPLLTFNPGLICGNESASVGGGRRRGRTVAAWWLLANRSICEQLEEDMQQGGSPGNFP